MRPKDTASDGSISGSVTVEEKPAAWGDWRRTMDEIPMFFYLLEKEKTDFETCTFICSEPL